jgi:hypothetical protein
MLDAELIEVAREFAVRVHMRVVGIASSPVEPDAAKLAQLVALLDRDALEKKRSSTRRTLSTFIVCWPSRTSTMKSQ